MENINKTICTQGWPGGRGAPHVPPIKIFEKLAHKNAIKHDLPTDFLTTPSTPLKRICQKKPKDTPPWISNYCASINKTVEDKKNGVRNITLTESETLNVTIK